MLETSQLVRADMKDLAQKPAHNLAPCIPIDNGSVHSDSIEAYGKHFYDD